MSYLKLCHSGAITKLDLNYLFLWGLILLLANTALKVQTNVTQSQTWYDHELIIEKLRSRHIALLFLIAIAAVAYLFLISAISTLLQTIAMVLWAFTATFLTLGDLLNLFASGLTLKMRNMKIISEFSVLDLISIWISLVVSVVWALSKLWIFNDLIVCAMVIGIVKYIHITSF